MNTMLHTCIAFFLFFYFWLIQQGLAYGQTRQQELIWYAYPEQKDRQENGHAEEFINN